MGLFSKEPKEEFKSCGNCADEIRKGNWNLESSFALGHVACNVCGGQLPFIGEALMSIQTRLKNIEETLDKYGIYL